MTTVQMCIWRWKITGISFIVTLFSIARGTVNPLRFLEYKFSAFSPTDEKYLPETRDAVAGYER